MTNQLRNATFSPKTIAVGAATTANSSGVYVVNGAYTLTLGSGLVVGDIVVVYNNHSADITIEDGPFTDFHADNDTAPNTDYQLATHAMATITIISSTTAVIAGAGVST